MTKSERRLLIGFTALGVATLLCAIATAGAFILAGSGFQAAGLGGAKLPAADTIAHVVEPIRMNGERAVQSARERAAAAESRLELPLPAAQLANGADLVKLYEQVNPGVVSVEVSVNVSNPFGGEDFEQQGSGSGFVYDDDTIVTNNHVAGDAKTVEIRFFDGERRTGTVVATDRFSDLAAIRVDDMPASARVLPLIDDFRELRVGQPVIAIGNPFGKANSMSYGIVSALGRTIPDGVTRFAIPQTIQTDAAINPGNSGGPLLNLRGQVIGVNAQINTSNVRVVGPPGNSGVGFAIPASIVAKVIPGLLKDGKYGWSYLGITGAGEMSVDMARANNLNGTRGALILQVPPGGPASGKLQGADNVSQAELGGQRLDSLTDQVPTGGDIVIAADGQPIASFDDLLTYVALETRPGQTVELTVLRDGQEVTVPVTVQERPADFGE
jgi:2-alkenal reductase